ncbi:membrane cofactor protein-like isoform X2 [Hippopotamus amphibius kiboko]|uniref:membrane cofactor protein-like isoform X2 n=1 Tax=Hippopotamus amphibius kiboko TaxID=575201 RepID=UPI002599D7FB|nr:membrane cofactor protein-like isoform X2 [Hippopotamus amphibius kiboko]
MTASCALRKASPYRPESSFSSRCFVGMLLVAPLLLLPLSSDACDEPPRFATMQLQNASKPSYSSGDKLYYACRPGYQLKRTGLATPSLSIVCQEDNTWSSLEEACQKKRCPTLEELQNGQIEYTNASIDFGSQVHYSCDKGYYLIGESIRHCQVAGSIVDWSDAPPICEKILCKPPEDIANGKYTNTGKDIFAYNEVVTYSCNPATGTDEYSLIGNATLVCVGNDEWSSDPPECKVVKCVFPTIINGKIVSGLGQKFYYSARVEFECNKGYKLNGSRTTVCGANSTWEPEIPTCVEELTTPTTQPPISSTSVSTRVPVPSGPDSKPTHRTVTPGSGHPGHDSAGDETPKAERLGAGIIVAIVLGTFLGLGVLAGSVYFCLCRKNKRDVYFFLRPEERKVCFYH